ncbi:MAG: molybdenum cofactor guanylyltransferase [Firmicutes bacterium]|nr:molybdenum cofactor guanylyltransferase [Oscillospiraceae bacterium]MBO6157852.1 molybdenum cofactor guanylyltransferase [Bacillota bacterium]
MKMEEVSAIILAGGRSSRMGTDKAKLKQGDQTLLELMAEKLRRLGISEIVVSGCPDCPEGTSYVPDLIPDKGPLSGIHAGLRQIRHRSALVLPVDMPLIQEETLRLLVQAHVNTGDGSLCSPITALTLNGDLEPLIAVYDAFLAEDCERILREEKHSPRRLFEKYGFTSVAFTGDPVSLMNCNTPEEYELVLKAAHGRLLSF